MEFFSGPAVPFAVLVVVALCAWMLGHRHARSLTGVEGRDPARGAASGLYVAQPSSADARAHDAMEGHAAGSGAHIDRDTARAGDGAAPCPDAARKGRKVALEAAISLGDVHEEMIAYRRREHVLFGAQGDAMAIELTPAADRNPCHNLGPNGQPTCPPRDHAVASRARKDPGDADSADPRGVTMLQPALPSERV